MTQKITARPPTPEERMAKALERIVELLEYNIRKKEVEGMW